MSEPEIFPSTVPEAIHCVGRKQADLEISIDGLMVDDGTGLTTVGGAGSSQTQTNGTVMEEAPDDNSKSKSEAGQWAF